METENNKSEEKLRLLISMGSEGIKMLAILAAELIGGINMANSFGSIYDPNRRFHIIPSCYNDKGYWSL